jgi:shikimate dehydrogenase
MRVFGLLGRSLAHSFSQAYFSQKFARLGLADYRYELFELPEASDLPQLLARQPDLAGLNVTIPYKEKIWPYLARVAPSAELVGAVNVIEFLPGGELVGHNTDYVGFRESLRTFYPAVAAPRRALVLGTGGAAKAVAAALHELAIPYQLVSRQPGGAHLTYEELTPSLLAGYSLLINTTPLGTYPAVAACPPLPYAALTPQHYLFDLIYNPHETLFLAQGRAAGAHIHNGLDMLERQAEAAWAIWQRSR